jgi:serine/alanine adding enzyme
MELIVKTNKEITGSEICRDLPDFVDFKFSTHPVWLDVINKSFNNDCYLILAQDGDKTIGFLPLVLLKSRIFGKFLISIPYLNYGGPVGVNPQVKERLVHKAEELAFKLKTDFLEIREDRPYKWGLIEKTSKITLILDLPTEPDELLLKFKAKLRSQIRRPLKEGMYFKIGRIELLDHFYKCYVINMRDLGTPVYSKSFFQNIVSLFSKYTRIGVVYTKDSQPAASGFIFLYGNTVEIPWASSIGKYNKYSPNMLLYWEFIRYSILNGFSKFDFGRCSPGGGTHKFKKQWGGTEKQLYWYYWLSSNRKSLPRINPSNKKYKTFIYIWRHLPLWLTKCIGPGIVKNLP